MNADVVHRLGAMACAAVGGLWLVGAVAARRRRQRALRRGALLVGGGFSGPGRAAAAASVAGVVPVNVGFGAAPGGADSASGNLRGRGDAHPGGGAGGDLDPVVALGAAVLRDTVREVPALRRGRRWLLAVGAACAGYALVGGALGGLLGTLCGGGVWWWQGRPVPVEEFDVARAVRELPLAADLLAACIAAGADPVTAARVVGESLEGPVGQRLAWGAAELRLGGEPAEAWRRLASIPGARPLARLLERAGDSGAPAAAPVARLAAEARAECGRSATATARRAAVLITAPVGLCFLPAFITVGVVPILIGLAGGLFGGGGG